MNWTFLAIALFIIFFVFVIWRQGKRRVDGGPPPSEAAIAQVVNNSGALLEKARLGSIEFTENLKMCADGCSTGFKDMRGGNHIIAVQSAEELEWVEIGTLGPFESNHRYAVNIVARAAEQVCAELWERRQTDSTFNDDTTKTLLGTTCIEETQASAQVVNNSGKLLQAVKVGEVSFSENLALCVSGCSTGFLRIGGGDNTISYQLSTDPAWVEIGKLGPFTSGINLAVNMISAGDTICAELWHRKQANTSFNEDTTKERIGSNCP